MSSGAFVSALYELDSGETQLCRVQPETLVGNPANTGAATIPGRLVLGKGNRAFGIRPRRITGKWTTAPANYLPGGSVSQVIMTKLLYDGIALGSDRTYLGGTFEVTGKKGESEG